MQISELDCVGVLGASGLVGTELITILAEQGVNQITVDVNANAPLWFLAIPDQASLEITPTLLQRGATVIDLSAAHRDDATVPLVVPSLNGNLLDASPSLIASPNCTATILAIAVAPLLPLGLTSITVTTMQAISGAGSAALDLLEQQTRDSLEGNCHHAADTWAFNVLCHESAINTDSGLSGEEQKVIDETRRLLDLPSITIIPTCLRVPVRRTHVESIVVQCDEQIDEQKIREAFDSAPGIRVLDDRDQSTFPSSHSADGRDTVDVGHIRVDGHAISFLAAGDQLRVGAALNAVEIARRLPG